MRILRSILWVICILILLAIGSVMALYFLVTPESVQNRLQTSFNQAGLTLRTNELPIVRVLPTISISLPSAQLFDSQNKLVAFYRSAQLNVSPWWLAFGKIHVDHVLIDGFSLQETECPTPSMWLKNNITDKTKLIDDVTIGSVELNNSDLHFKYNGYIFNLQNLRATVGAPAPQMHAPVALATQVQLLPDNLLLDMEAALSLDLNLAVGQMSFENLLVKANATQQGRSFQVQLTSPLAQITENDLYVKTAQIQISGDQSLGDITVSAAELRLDETTWQAPDLYVQYSKGSGDQALKLDLRSPIIFERKKVAMAADHIQGSVVLPGQSETIPVSGNIKTDWNNEKIRGQLFARVHGAPMSFSGQSAGFDYPAIEGDIVFGRLELQDFSVFNSLQKAQKSLSLELLNEEPVHSTTEATETSATDSQSAESPVDTPEATPTEQSESTLLETEDADLNKENSQEENKKLEATATPTAVPSQTQTLAEGSEVETALGVKDFDFLNRFDFKGTLVVGELALGPVKLAQLKSDMTVKNGILRLPKASALTYDGKTEVDVHVNSKGHWSVTYRGESVNLSSLLQDASGNGKNSGVLDLQANLYGNGFTEETLNGQIGFSASRARIFGFNLDEAVKDLRAYKDPVQNNELFTEANLIGGVATIHNGKAMIERLSMDLGSAHLRGQAEVDLTEGSLSGRLFGKNTSSLSLTTLLSGQWYSPVVTLDTQKIRQDNDLVSKPKPKETPKESGWDKLKNFFRDRF